MRPALLATGIAGVLTAAGLCAPAMVHTQGLPPAASALGAGPADGESRPAFSDFIAGVRAEALSRGIREDTVDQALASVGEPEPTVIERDRAQPESVLTLEQYVARRLTKKAVRSARLMYAAHRALLARIGKRYGVPPAVIVGIWGIESNFGRFSGVRPTIPTLATLAWDRRRPAFFRAELFDALEILDRGDIDLEHLRGSWAGAMGQAQFMPSSYLAYAEDFDGDGRRDIWSSPADVFASIANYLKGHGWTPGQPWGREVRVTAAAGRRIAADVARRNGGCQAKGDMTVALPIARWRRLGVHLANGRPIPASTAEASLVSGDSRHFLVYPNYDALLAYNCAHAYAVSVALLGDTLRTATR